MHPDLKGHRLLVTGGSRGTGAAVVRLLGFLLAPWASAITGQILNVNSGTVLCG